MYLDKSLHLEWQVLASQSLEHEPYSGLEEVRMQAGSPCFPFTHRNNFYPNSSVVYKNSVIKSTTACIKGSCSHGTASTCILFVYIRERFVHIRRWKYRCCLFLIINIRAQAEKKWSYMILYKGIKSMQHCTALFIASLTVLISFIFIQIH